MKRGALCLILTVAVGGLAFAWPDGDQEDNEERIAFGQTPAAVQAAILELTTERALTEIDKVDKGGITVYDVEYKAGDKTHSATLAASGAMIVREQQIGVNSLPAAVKEKIGSEFTGAAVVKAEAVTFHYYKVEIVADGKTFEVKALASGHLDDDDDDDD